jgi:hypothetical protein
MLTLFSLPRAFSGSTGLIQDNAIGSWVRLGAGCEVILFGDDAGVGEAARRHGARHEPQVTRTAQGTPILSDVFARAQAIASNPMLCFVNADIILFDEVLAATRRVAAVHQRFLIVSSRFNHWIEEPLVFAAGWDRELRALARGIGDMYPAAGSDIFIFPRGLFDTIPPFAIGRSFWDNWLMYHARASRAPLIDATDAITAVHQNHDYGHVAGLPPGPDSSKLFHLTEEGRMNLALAGGVGRLTTAYDATEVLTANRELHSTLRPRLIRRRLKASVRRAASSVAPGAWKMLCRLRDAASPRQHA